MAKAKKIDQKIEILPPNFQVVHLKLEGLAPLMTHKFSEKMRKQMEARQTSSEATRAKREPKDYAAEFNAARYISTSGWDGLPTQAIRASMIAACRTVDGLSMAMAKGVFRVIPQGRDKEDGTPLARIHGKAVHDTRPVRLESGVADMRNRPRYDDWYCEIAVEFDADTLSAQDVGNLLARAGQQVGLCELRPQGKKSFGGDFGLFAVKTVSKRLKSVA